MITVNVISLGQVAAARDTVITRTIVGPLLPAVA